MKKYTKKQLEKILRDALPKLEKARSNFLKANNIKNEKEIPTKISKSF